MIKKTVILQDPNGMHLRVAAKVVKASRDHQSKVVLFANDKKASAASILELLMLGAAGKSTVTIVVDGQDEQKAMDRMETALVDGAGI